MSDDQRITCVALDDEPLALQLISTYAGRLSQLSPKGFFNNPDDARSCLESGNIDLLFLDIQMPDINGLQFLKQLKKPPMVIFTTAFAEFAVEGFNLDAVDYLLKPFDFQRFEKAVNKALEYSRFLGSQGLNIQENQHKVPANFLFVKVEYSVQQISFDDILYIEGFDDYIKIHTGGKPILTLLSLKSVLEMLPPDRFVRVHRSYIVALDKIERIRAQKILTAGKELPIGDTYKEKLKMKFSSTR
jgi:DNA-binding LytR/AlgR family response regulator